MSTTHLITGSTGLIGAALLLRLAEHTDDEFVCLVRAPGARLHDTLRRAASAYAVQPGVLAGALRRTRIVEGDLATPFPLRTAARVEVWHSAAVLHFRRSTWRTTFRTNVHGTRRMLELARAVDAVGFNYLSTAYVAGTATGAIGEVPASPSTARTPYELSKIAAERMLLEVRDMPVRVLRPSVVVGHSETLAYPGTPSGAYKIQQLIAAYYRAVPPTVRPGVRALPDEPFDIVPVDHVVAEAHELSDLGTTGIHHLTNPTPPPTGALLTALFTNCQAPPPTYTSGDPLLNMALAPYLPYLNNPQHFTRTRPGTPWTPDHETLRAMFRPFVVRPAPIPA
ncbi:SDR family oxidoreductase [Streptomyces niveiscabiei]|uniref:SDR family oxidoreductase n=1 Tax=Streptomyces niveiscabiei TaxID=164115 RepID=A0ABW9HXM6_9ACTN